MLAWTCQPAHSICPYVLSWQISMQPLAPWSGAIEEYMWHMQAWPEVYCVYMLESV